MDGPLVEKNGTMVTISLCNPRCYSHQIHLRKHLERIRITEIVTSILMRGSLSNIFHIKYILDNLDNVDPPKVIFGDERGVKLRGDVTMSQKI